MQEFIYFRLFINLTKYFFIYHIFMILKLTFEDASDLASVAGIRADFLEGRFNLHVVNLMKGCRERVPNLLQIYLHVWFHSEFQKLVQTCGPQQALSILRCDLENVSTWERTLAQY